MKIKQIVLIAFFFFLQTLFCDLSKGQPYLNKKYPQKEIKMFVHRELGIMFRYNPVIEDIEHSSVDIGTWKQRNLKRFGISFKSPIYYKASLKKWDFLFYSTPTDSVYELDFGNGVTVQIYQSKKKFYEIAFAEGFKQYRKGGELVPDSRWDTVTVPILDSSWVMQGLSGMPWSAPFLNGKEWKGLRCKSDTRGYSDSEPYSYSAECWFSLMVHPISENRNLVIFYQEWPPMTDESKANSQRLDEQDFYDLVASIKFIKDKK
jgi:hypothetical protein